MSSYLKISEFARISGIPRKNLIYYDEIGLLKPDKIDDNGYRLYSYQQVYLVSIIAAFRELGMPLKEIKEYMDSRTPARLIEVFEQQSIILEEKLEHLRGIQHMIDFRIQATKQAEQVSLSNIVLTECPEEIFFASEELKLVEEEQVEGTLVDFYDRYEAERMIYGYPIGVSISKEQLLTENWLLPNRFFSRQLPSHIKACRYVKPAGLYVISFCQTDTPVPTETYRRMLEYIKKNNLTISGCSYEEFLLDEVCVMKPEEYILQISIQVAKSL